MSCLFQKLFQKILNGANLKEKSTIT